MQSTNVEPLASDQIAAAGAVLARGFHDDALTVHMIPDAAARAYALPTHFTAFVRLGYLFGEVFSTPGESRGAAVWFAPGRWELGSAELDRAGVTALASALPDGAFAQFENVTGHLELLHKRDVPSDHWYLALLGVDTPWQGKGVGAALMCPVLDRANADGLPCYLETVQPRNVSFYEHHGFQVVVEDVEPSSGLRFWTFRRDAR